MKKTKIICTLGPASNNRETLKALMENGMDIARFNFSHGDHEEQKGRVDMIRSFVRSLICLLPCFLTQRDRRSVPDF